MPHLLHLVLGIVHNPHRVGELEAVAEFLELLLQDVYMLVTVIQPVTPDHLQSLETQRQSRETRAHL